MWSSHFRPALLVAALALAHIAGCGSETATTAGSGTAIASAAPSSATPAPATASGTDSAAPTGDEAALPHENLPLGLDEVFVLIPEDNPITAEKVELGRLLYFDGRLSRDGTVACATCHSPDTGWTDTGPTSTGIDGQVGGRRAPTVINRIFSGPQFWDGRAASLEDQAKGPIENPIEMGFTHDEVVARIGGIAGYGPYFEKAFGDPMVDIDRIAKAIATFERTIVAGNSPYDRWIIDGDETALDESAKRGFEVFRGAGACGTCHSGFNFTDERYHNLGVGWDGRKLADKGRHDVTKSAVEAGAFKTPTLRNLAARAPYMHDGSEATLHDVIELYDRGGNPNPSLDKEMKPLKLTDEQKKDLLAFLAALEGHVTEVTVPTEFPGGWKPGMAVE